MKKFPIFPIPGRGDFIRQPLYVGDFIKIIESCILNFEINGVFDITGLQQITYLKLMKLIKNNINNKPLFIFIPIKIFSFLLKIWSLISKNPAFTDTQLKALTAGDKFEVINWPKIFSVTPTNIKEAIKLNIPIVAIVDTNSNPSGINFPIPGNDDARRAINLYCELIKQTILDAQKNIKHVENEEIGKDVGMHIIAKKPLSILSENFPSDILEREKELFLAETEKLGKPKEISEKIVQGKIQKLYKDNCLMEQMFVKDDSLSVKKHLAQANARFEITGAYKKSVYSISVVFNEFQRFSVSFMESQSILESFSGFLRVSVYFRVIQ